MTTPSAGRPDPESVEGPDATASSQVIFSGIDGTTGEPALPPLTVADVGTVARGDQLDLDELARLRARTRAAQTDTLGVVEGIDTEDLAEAGWGVIIPADTDPSIREALRPLFELRRSQAEAGKRGRYRELSGADAYQEGETERKFLVRQGMAPGSPADPDRLPYYLLIIGGPERVPFEFQYQLDVTYAVGRLDLETPDDYAHYAAAVVAADQAAPKPRELMLFGPHNADDPATGLSVDHLLRPLATHLADVVRGPWTVSSEIGPGHATKDRLGDLLAGDTAPALLMTAGHGMVFPSGNARQRTDQGALLCQEWPGPKGWRAAIPPTFYFSASDLAPSAGPGGMIALLFACYGAGTPRFDDFAQSGGGRKEIAPAPFVSSLARRMLGHPAGPALAVVGHVERAMSYSFAWPGAGEQLGAFESVLTAIVNGRRLGAAMEFLNDRYSALTVELDDLRERLRYNEAVDPVELAGLWTARNDARNYVILGDPAVRHPAGTSP